MRSESEFDLDWNHAEDDFVPCQRRYIKYIKEFKICGAFVSAKTRNYKSFNRTTGLLYLRFKNSFFFSRQRLTVSAMTLGDLMSVGQQGPVLENSKGHLAFRGIKHKHKIPLSLNKTLSKKKKKNKPDLCFSV